MLPRFPDESDALPQFDLEETAEIRPSAREIPPPPMLPSFESLTSEPSIVPVALESSDLEEEPREDEAFDLEETVRTRRKVPRRATMMFVAACGAIGAFVLAVLASAPGETSALSASLVVPRIEVADEPASAAPPPPAPTTGTLVAPAWTKGRRVWIDGNPLAGHAPKIDAPCGKHQVKVGANGKTRAVSIPCGGEIKVAP
ncbi:MAG: hypothetical protein ACXWUG_23350 [Polyangiales bacterium]